MQFIGRYQLGKTVPLLCITKNAAGAPSVPSRPPVVTIWSPSAKVMTVALPILDRYLYNGVFLGHLFLGPLFSVGLYQASYYYEVSTYQGVQLDNFEIMPGGDPNGTVNAMYFYQRPQAAFIVQSLDSGNIKQGRNPTI